MNVLSTLCSLSKVSWSSPNAIKWVLILEIAKSDSASECTVSGLVTVSFIPLASSSLFAS